MHTVRENPGSHLDIDKIHELDGKCPLPGANTLIVNRVGHGHHLSQGKMVGKNESRVEPPAPSFTMIKTHPSPTGTANRKVIGKGNINIESATARVVTLNKIDRNQRAKIGKRG